MTPHEESLFVRRFTRAIRRMVLTLIAQHAVDVRYGAVSGTAPFEVVLDGATNATPAVASGGYTPTVGDRVFVLVVRHEQIVVNKL